MTITVSVFPDNHTQADGRRFVLEIFEDGIGEVTRRRYLSEDGANYQAVADARIPKIEARLVEIEKGEHVALDKQPTSLRFQTVPELLLQIRQDYLTATGRNACIIAKWIVDRLDDATITPAQCQTAWGASPAEWSAINGTMDTYAAAIVSVDGAVGE